MRAILRYSALKAIRAAALAALSFMCAAQMAFAQYNPPRPGFGRAGQRPVMMRPYIPTRRVFIVRPARTFFAPQRFLFWDSSLFAFGVRLGINPVPWRNCGPYVGWTWAYGCYAVPIYVGSEERELAKLYMKDGTVYDVTDYWIVNGQLHFMTIDASGAKWDEHIVDSDQLDLQKTADVAKERGFRFVLRNEPLDQYLRDHPEIGQSKGSPQQ
jgi:hypothetical protein